MLTNCLAECAHLTINVSQIERDIGRKSSFFHTPLHSTPQLGGSRRYSATPFGTEKLEWGLGYPMVKIIRRYLYSFWRNSHERDGRTPGDGIYRAYAYASRGKNRSSGFAAVGGRKSPFPITLAIALYNSLYYRTIRDINGCE